jgi:AraC family transcriptional regulator
VGWGVGISGVNVRLSVRYMRPSSVLYIRATGPYDQSAKAAWGRMRTWLAAQSTIKPVTQGIGFIRDNPDRTGPFLRRYDACVTVVPGLDIDYHAGVARQTLPGGTFAVYTHIGDHAHLAEAFQTLKHEATPTRGLKIDEDRAFMEIYLDDPAKVALQQCRTELCLPIMASAVADLDHYTAHRMAGAA